MIPMRDGIRLATDVYRDVDAPSGPVLLLRTPYGKEAVRGSDLYPAMFAMFDLGFAVVYQDVRSTTKSEGGGFSGDTSDQSAMTDAADTFAWLRSQPWCDGKIGMFGASYMGFTQMRAVMNEDDDLVIAPSVSTYDGYHLPYMSLGGTQDLGTILSWTYMLALADAMRAGNVDDVGLILAVMSDPIGMVEHLPLIDHPLLDKYAPQWRAWMEHPDFDEAWQQWYGFDPGKVRSPALHIGGWFDISNGATVRAYEMLRDGAATEFARANQRLVMGPWTHGNSSGQTADVYFGLTSSFAGSGRDKIYGNFYRETFAGQDASSKPVHIFVMGLNEWRDEEAWPLPDTRYVDYYLDSRGAANTSGGDGELRSSPPTHVAADVYVYDPMNPAPSHGGVVFHPNEIGRSGPTNLSPITGRSDVLAYSTPVLERDTEVTGPVRLVLHISSSAPDTDFVGRLVDVHPDGRELFVTEGVIRARYRKLVEQAGADGTRRGVRAGDRPDEHVPRVRAGTPDQAARRQHQLPALVAQLEHRWRHPIGARERLRERGEPRAPRPRAPVEADPADHRAAGPVSVGWVAGA
ncbi:MAG: CocE/NonD family hydrolase [Ilumatobacteraceae bacterium]